MKLNELKSAVNKKTRTRVGRGLGSGLGKTSGRGQKGSLIKDGIISKANDGIVIIATGKLDKKLTVKARRFTKAAKEQIEALGGKTEVI